MSSSAVPAAGRTSAPGHGRITVARRALDRVVSAVTADTFGVTAGSVRVQLSDREGRLALRVRTPIRVISLDRVRQTPDIVETSGGTVLRRGEDGQQTIGERVSALAGVDVAHVTVELTGIQICPEKRVA